MANAGKKIPGSVVTHKPPIIGIDITSAIVPYTVYKGIGITNFPSIPNSFSLYLFLSIINCFILE